MAFPFLSWCFSLRFLLPSPPPSPPPPPSLNTYTQTNTWTQGERRVSGKKKKQQRIHIISFLKSNKYKGICPPDWEKQPFAYLHWFFFCMNIRWIIRLFHKVLPRCPCRRCCRHPSPCHLFLCRGFGLVLLWSYHAHLYPSLARGHLYLLVQKQKMKTGWHRVKFWATKSQYCQILYQSKWWVVQSPNSPLPLSLHFLYWLSSFE